MPEEARAQGNDSEFVQRLNEAESLLEEAVANDPLSTDTRFYLGAALYGLGHYGAAEDMLVRSIELGPPGGQARLMLANVYARTGNSRQRWNKQTAFWMKTPVRRNARPSSRFGPRSNPQSGGDHRTTP